MSEYRIKNAKQIAAEIHVPGDKSISHRAVMLAGLSNGTCVISGFLPSADCLATVECMRRLGVKIRGIDDDGNEWKPRMEHDKPEIGPTRLEVTGCAMKLSPPAGDLDCGNSGTTMRLLAGLLAGQPFNSRLIGDESLSGRPMKRIMEPLSTMEADIESEGTNGCPPLQIHGNPNLKSIRYTLPIASAQVKGAVLLAGLFAQGKTTVVQPLKTRDHTEKMLNYFMVKTLRHGQSLSVYGGQVLESRDYSIPGDISSAAFWAVAAAAQPGSDLIIRDVGLNPTRTGILKILVRMGAQITEVVNGNIDGEPFGNVSIKGGLLKGTEIEGNEIPNVIDELPILAVAGALAEGRTVIRDAQELRVKESDRLHALATNLREMGVEVRELYDGLEIIGGSPLKGARLDSHGDHRIAMAFAIAGLFAEGETIIRGVECVETSYPGFETDLKRFQSKSITAEMLTPVMTSLPRSEDHIKSKTKKPKEEPPSQ